MASITMEMDLPEGVELISYERHGQGHCFEVSWPFPERIRCDRCRHEEAAKFEYKDKAQVIRDLDVWGQPSFWTYQTVFHRCSRCNHRQHLLAPFKRKKVTYTYRFEEQVLQMLVGSNEEEVAARLGISAETVALIVRNQLGELQQVDPQRVITDVGLDELSLKKRHKLYVTILTDLSDPERPRVLAVAPGKDEAAARSCLECLTVEQRQQVQTCRLDMSMAFHNAAEKLLPNAKRIVDRFHVAKNFNEVVDAKRKKITAAYKAKLSKKERKEFRCLMWEFRRHPKDLSAEEKEKLEALFVKLPTLKKLYKLRLRFQEIFDTAKNADQAALELCGLRLEAFFEEIDLEPFFATYENWEEEILHYFAAGQTSAQVEGINNKARVITKRAYGLKSHESLWRRLILDVNEAKNLITRSIKSIHELVDQFRVIFRPFCT